jgi:hypothetical protein
VEAAHPRGAAGWSEAVEVDPIFAAGFGGEVDEVRAFMIVVLPDQGAVQLYQTDAPSGDPPSGGSPGSLVAPQL